MEYYRVAGDHESIGRVSSILGGASPSAVASRIEEADTPEELRMAFSSSDLLVSSQPEDRRAEVRATIKKFMSLKFSRLQEERRLKLAFLDGHLLSKPKGSSEIARETGVSKPTVLKALKKLESYGITSKTGKGRYTKYIALRATEA